MNSQGLTLIDAILPKFQDKRLTLAKEIVLIFSFALFTGFCAKIKIEIGTVPITLQTLAVLLSGALLGKIRGAASQLAYLLLGLAGIPWFARGGGISYIFSPTFGYLLGFVLAAYFVGWLCEKGFDRKIHTATFAMLMGNIILYFPGLLWLAKFVGLKKAFAVGLYPFIIGDFFKILLAASILPLAWKFFGCFNKPK